MNSEERYPFFVKLIDGHNGSESFYRFFTVTAQDQSHVLPVHLFNGLNDSFPAVMAAAIKVEISTVDEILNFLEKSERFKTRKV